MREPRIVDVRDDRQLRQEIKEIERLLREARERERVARLDVGHWTRVLAGLHRVLPERRT